MNVLSLFGGIEVGYQAVLDRGFEIENYYSSEICPNAIKVAKDNFPNIQHIGTVVGLDVKKLPKIDILFAGFPCQTVSLANRGGARHTLR